MRSFTLSRKNSSVSIKNKKLRSQEGKYAQVFSNAAIFTKNKLYRYSSRGLHLWSLKSVWKQTLDFFKVHVWMVNKATHTSQCLIDDVYIKIVLMKNIFINVPVFNVTNAFCC